MVARRNGPHSLAGGTNLESVGPLRESHLAAAAAAAAAGVVALSTSPRPLNSFLFLPQRVPPRPLFFLVFPSGGSAIHNWKLVSELESRRRRPIQFRCRGRVGTLTQLQSGRPSRRRTDA